jgi:hypothetical protein
VGNTIIRSVDKSALSSGGHNRQQQVSTSQAGSPRAGLHVRIAGRDEIFLILRVDRTRHLADLLRHGAVRKVQAGVPLALLHVVETKAAPTGKSLESRDDSELSEQAS